MNSKLLIVSVDEEIRAQVKRVLANDHKILIAEDHRQAIETFRAEQPPVVLLDFGMPPAHPENGLALLSDLLAVNRRSKIVVITGQDEKESVLRAIGAGAYDFLCLPLETGKLKFLLKRCFQVAQLEQEYREMQQLLQSDAFEGILGACQPMQTVFDTIRKVAITDAPVLILGESGTGKEMAARAIHRKGSRRNGPFVAINCSAIPETLLESELFGHEKGAFTGAHIQRKGRIETAGGGTLFLDEIGEIPLPLQVKLLRFLQDQRIQRVGGREETQIDVRVIAATNSDLKKAMAAGSFREDLFYRLAVVQIVMPPLRERESDILLLAQSFLQRFASQARKEGLSFDRAAVQALGSHSWPGNVRELENCIRRAVIMADGKRLTVQDLEFAPVSRVNGGTLKAAREAVEREVVERVLRKHSGKITTAAAELGISRPTLYELIERLGVAKE